MSLIVLTAPGAAPRQLLLSKTQPLSIGRHAISDVRIDHSAVGMLHARISWAKRQYEITAAGADGVDVNGALVRQAALNVGDVIRIGDCDLLFTTPEALKSALPKIPPTAQPAPPRDELDVGLQQVSEEIPTWFQPPKPPAVPPSPPQSSKPDSSSKKPPQESKSPPPKSARDDLEVFSQPELVIEDLEQDSPVPVGVPMLSRGGTTGGTASKEDAPLKALREALSASRQRPGQQELIRSPLALGLTVGGILLLLAAIVFWFLIGREESKRYLEAARGEFEQGKFVQAIQLYEEFLIRFPGDQDAETARHELSKARVRKEIDSSAPDWGRGLDELKALIERHRDDVGFIGLQPDIVEYARKIANGACVTADRLHDRSIFETSEEATRIVERYLDDKERRAGALAEIAAARSKAEASLIKHAAFVEGVAQIEAELKGSRALDALQIHRDLGRRYAEFQDDPQLAKLRQSAVDLERSLVTPHEGRLEPEPAKEATGAPLVATLNANTRPRTDEPRSGRNVYMLAADVLYGVDTGNGDPVWRRVVGTNLPFFPIELPLDVEALLLQNTHTGHVECLERSTGRLLWQQAHTCCVAGPPLIDNRIGYFTTRDGELQQIDLETGTVLARIGFSQPLASAPTLIGEQDRLIVVGEREVAYLLTLRPLEIQAVIPLDHTAGAIPVSPLRMGPLVLLAENDRADSCRLQVFDTRDPQQPFVRVAEHRLRGVVRDPPAIRGRQLAVSSWPERVTAFTVSADAGQPPLSPVAETQVAGAQSTSAWLETGPDDQIWMTSTAVRRLKLTTDSLEIDPNFTAIGVATQPPQMLGEQLFVARRAADSTAIRFSRITRDTFAGVWRTNFGDGVRETTVNPAGELVALSDAGEVYRLRPEILSAGGPLLRSNVSLEVPADATQPLITSSLSGGRFAAVTSGPQPILFVIRETAQVQSRFTLSANVEAAPVDLRDAIVLPHPGRLSAVRSSGPRIEDYLVPVDADPPARWTYLITLSADECLAFDAAGKVVRIELRDQPVAALTSTGEAVFEHPPALPPVRLDAERLAIVTSDRTLHQFDTTRLESTETLPLPAAPLAGPWVVEDQVLVELAQGGLSSFTAGETWQLKWTLPLDNARLAGGPVLFQSELCLPLVGGRVLFVNPNDGTIVRTASAGQQLHETPIPFADSVVFPTADGGLIDASQLVPGGP